MHARDGQFISPATANAHISLCYVFVLILYIHFIYTRFNLINQNFIGKSNVGHPFPTHVIIVGIYVLKLVNCKYNLLTAINKILLL